MTVKEKQVIHASIIKNPGSKGLGQDIEIPDTLAILDQPKVSPAATQGCFRVLTPEDGDKRVVWDRRYMDQIRDAKALFDKLVLAGMKPYLAKGGKATKTIMDIFDANAEEVIFLRWLKLSGVDLVCL